MESGGFMPNEKHMTKNATPTLATKDRVVEANSVKQPTTLVET